MALGGLTSLFSQSTVQAVGAGLLTGAIGGTALVATGVIPLGAETVTPATIQLLACPDAGPALAQISDGQRLLVTGKSADGTWLEVYIGQPGVDRAWAEASSLSVESGLETLPVVACDAPTAPSPAPLPSPAATASPTVTIEPTLIPSASPSPSPIPSATARPTATATVRATATPKPTPTKPAATKTPKPAATKTPTTPPATPTPTPTPTPDTQGPSLSNLTVTATGGSGGNGDYYINGPSSNCTPHSATVSVNASDPSGVASITLFYWPGNSGVLNVQMSPAGGNTWEGTINAQDGWSDSMSNEDPNGLIAYWVVATDSKGNTRQLDYSNNYRLYSNGVCLI
jgi:hypothetical protein